MKTMDKVLYEAPAAEVLEMRVEKYICVSGKFESSRASYGTASADDGTELTWD